MRSGGSMAGKQCLSSIMSLGALACSFSGRAKRKGVLEEDVEDEWRHRPTPESWQMCFGNANE